MMDIALPTNYLQYVIPAEGVGLYTVAKEIGAMTDEDFKKLLVIDKHNLDEEVTHQPEWFFRVSEACADAINHRDLLKEQLATVDAQADALIRSSANEKYTEKMVQNHVLRSQDHMEAFKAYLEAKRVADMWSNLKDAFHQRRYLLRDLVQLATAAYFESPTIARKSDGYYERGLKKRAELTERLSKGSSPAV